MSSNVHDSSSSSSLINTNYHRYNDNQSDDLEGSTDPIKDIVSKALESRSYCRGYRKDEELGTLISALNQEKLDALFQQIASLSSPELDKALEKIFKTVTYKQLIASYTNRTGLNAEDFLKNLRGLIAQVSNCNKLVSQVRRFPPVSYNAPKANALDNLLLAYNFFSADHTPEGAWEAVQTLQIYATLLIAPFLISGVLDDTLSGYTPLRRIDYLYTVVGCMLAWYLFLKSYQFYKPIPTEIKPMRNFTVEALRGTIEPLLSREDVIQKIFSAGLQPVAL